MKIPTLSRKDRIIAVISTVWLIAWFVGALDESGGDFDDEFFMIFLIGGVIPVILVSGWRWIMGAPN